MDGKATLARWKSKTGKHWAELYVDRYGFTWRDSGGSGGSFSTKFTADDAMQYMQHLADIGCFQPDSNKTPMAVTTFMEVLE